MAEGQSITLKAAKYDKLGVLHCAVTREGLVVVAGEQRTLEDGKETTFEKSKIHVVRKGGDYTFTRRA